MEQITFNPSNEPYYSEDFIKGFKCGAERQFEADKKARPQGQWIWVEHPVFERCKCSLCGYCRQLKIPEPDNFCPNCGADMRERKDFQVIVNGNCTKCGKPIEGNSIFLCDECKSLMEGADDETRNETV